MCNVLGRIYLVVFVIRRTWVVLGTFSVGGWVNTNVIYDVSVRIVSSLFFILVLVVDIPN